MGKNKHNLHILLPITVFSSSGNDYIKRAFFLNELSKHFSIKIYCKKVEKEQVDTDIYRPLSENTKVIDFFKSTDITHVLKNIGHYRKKTEKLPEEELFFTMYPFRKTSIVISYLLLNKKLTIWVRSNSGVEFVPHSSKIISLFKRLALPIKRFLYRQLSKYIFKTNLVFYTSDIIIDTDNHINQHEIISCSDFNQNSDLIKKEFTKSICFVGGESPRKGLSVLLKALHQLPKNSLPKLNIIGTDRITSKRNKKLARGLDIELHGKIYQHELFYQKLAENDILVMPSFAEKQGKVQLEAMSAGVVPICSDSGGTHQTINNFYDGLLFKPGDVNGLTEKIKLLYSHKELYRKLQQNGLRSVSKLSLENQCYKMFEIINNYYIQQ
jgi:glycosyltransferase involved in cell wall biosynthesis